MVLSLHATHLKAASLIERPNPEPVRAWQTGPVAVRAIGLRDRHYAERLGWLNACFANVQTYVLRENDMAALSQVTQGFDLAVLHGADWPRLIRMAGQLRDLLPSKAIAALAPQAEPATTVRLLKSGFDDVLLLSMPIAEAQARMAALMRRYRTPPRQDKAAERQKIEELLAQRVADCNALPVGTRRLLALLCRNLGHTTPYYRIAHAVGTQCDHRTRRSLHVRMVTVRRALRAGWAVESVRGEGYRLVRLTTPGLASLA